MYPAMIKDAAAENQADARLSLEHARIVAMVHSRLFKKALAAPEKDDVAAYFICPDCGFTIGSRSPGKCPCCGVDAKNFFVIQ